MKKCLSLLVAVAFLTPSFAIAAISVDAHAQGSTLTGSTVSWSHTTTAGGVLVVGVGISNQTRTFSSCTYNSVPMGQVGFINGGDAGATAVYFLGSPASGTNTVLCTASANPDNSALGGVSVSFNGAHTSVGATSTTGVSPAASSISTNLSTTVDSSMIFAFGFQNGNSTSFTVSGTNQTQQDTTGLVTGAGGYGRFSGSTQTTTSSGSYTNSWSSSPNEVMKQVVVEIKPGSVSASTPILGLVGVRWIF